MLLNLLVIGAISLSSANYNNLSETYNSNSNITANEDYEFERYYTSDLRQFVANDHGKMGYIYSRFYVYRYPVINESNNNVQFYVTMINVVNEFTPGYQANLAGDSSFNRKKYLEICQTDFTLYESSHEVDRDFIIHSSAIKNLDISWPYSSSGSIATKTLTTNFGIGGSLQTGVGVNYEGLTVTKKDSFNLEFSLSNSTSITEAEPRVSHQKSPNDSFRYQWTYEYNDVGKTTLRSSVYGIYLVYPSGFALHYGSNFCFNIDISMKIRTCEKILGIKAYGYEQSFKYHTFVF